MSSTKVLNYQAILFQWRLVAALNCDTFGKQYNFTDCLTLESSRVMCSKQRTFYLKTMVQYFEFGLEHDNQVPLDVEFRGRGDQQWVIDFQHRGQEIPPKFIAVSFISPFADN